jgi:hypothetical protein
MRRFTAGGVALPGTMSRAHPRDMGRPAPGDARTPMEAAGAKLKRALDDRREGATSVEFRCTRAGAACPGNSRHADAEDHPAPDGRALHGRPARRHRRICPPTAGRADAPSGRRVPRTWPRVRRVRVPPRHDGAVFSGMASQGDRWICPRTRRPARTWPGRPGARVRDGRVLPGANTDTSGHDAVQAHRRG